MNYVVIDPKTGEVLRSGSMSSGKLQLQAKPGQVVLAGEARDDTHKLDLDTGELRRKSVEELSKSGVPAPGFVPSPPALDHPGTGHDSAPSK